MPWFSVSIATIVLATSPTMATTPWDFRGPLGVAIDTDHVVYVADFHHRRIARFTLDGQWLDPITMIDGYGPLAGPGGVSVGPGNRLTIVDTLNAKVVILDEQRQLRFVLDTGTAERNPQTHETVPSVAIDGKGRIFLPDTRHAQIRMFDAEGRLAATWGAVGQARGQFLYPHDLGGVACDDHGFVYVRERRGGRIQKYTVQGDHVATIGGPGTAGGAFDAAYGIAVLWNKLWVMEPSEGRIRIFTLDGIPLETHTGDKHFIHPVSMTSTSTGDLIIADWATNRIVRFDSQGRFLQAWGHRDDGMLSFEPPMIVTPPPGRPVRFSLHGDVDLEACRSAGIGRIYASMCLWRSITPIGDLVDQAKAMDIEVHPSVAMLTFGPADSQFIEQHPEYCMWRKDAREPMTSMLSWAQPEARRHRINQLLDLIGRMNVSGLMLDQVHYLSADYGYDPVAISGFFQQKGINPLTIPVNDAQWLQYRADFITDFLVTFRRRLAAHGKTVCLSVFGSGDGDPVTALHATMKDWRTWARMGIVDAVQAAPATRDIALIYETGRRTRTALPPRTHVNCFLLCDRDHLNTPALLRKGVEVAIAGGADEVTFTHLDTIGNLGLWETIVDIARGTRHSEPR